MEQPEDRDPTPPGLRLVRDLINTLDVGTGADSLATEDGLAAFAHTHRLTGPGLTKRDLPGIVRLREGLRAVCLAHNSGTPVPPETAVGLAALLRRTPLAVVFDAAGTATLEPVLPGPDGPGETATGAAALTARIAAAVAAAAADGTWTRLKACEAGDCHWAYYDRSPAGRRRWCDMAVCGSRAKMRAYRARRSPGS
ncbi:CGNR zinc finger domain-containing protein [Streptomyces sp. TRM 70361]|uniref:CGNR zinc finger domain-containing protein n=1 Tax=Streptomyces sp. TRM 70361 TaxID=3116553 RepID=UPI002E7B4FEB|nr:CGNR zinc finger domain-containing protein [Streptomyces sp. TRM 70361]MEE1938577.1 CGNR zinc finger domain-containing protein [Streptomyces sp. TRM 70361]